MIVTTIRSISFILFKQYLALVAIVCRRNWINHQWLVSCVHIPAIGTIYGSMPSNSSMASSIVGWTIFEWRTIPFRGKPAIRRALISMCLVGRPPKQWNGLILRILCKTTTMVLIIRSLYKHCWKKAINVAKICSEHRTIFARDQVNFRPVSSCHCIF